MVQHRRKEYTAHDAANQKLRLKCFASPLLRNQLEISVSDIILLGLLCQEGTGSRDVGWLAREVGCDKGGSLERLIADEQASTIFVI